MKDTFTSLFPHYNHKENPETAFKNSFSHSIHKSIDISQEPQVLRNYNHRKDNLKDYSESMYKLGPFAP